MLDQIDSANRIAPDRGNSDTLSLPENWRAVRLDDLTMPAQKSRGRIPLDVELIPFVPMSLLPEDALYVTKWEMRKPADVRSGVLVRDGDLLLAKITPCLENGKQGIVSGVPGGFAYATTEVIPIHASPALDAEFLALYLKQPDVRRLLAEKMEGTTGRQRLPRSVIEDLCIPLPPLSEQRAIAHVLRTVQQAKEATEAVIAATRELKKSLGRVCKAITT